MASGILLGTLTAELGGTVIIRCEKTGYSAEIEFKLKVFIFNHNDICENYEITFSLAHYSQSRVILI